MKAYCRIVLTDTNQILPWYYKTYQKAEDYIFYYLWRVGIKAYIIKERDKNDRQATEVNK